MGLLFRQIWFLFYIVCLSSGGTSAIFDEWIFAGTIITGSVTGRARFKVSFLELVSLVSTFCVFYKVQSRFFFFFLQNMVFVRAFFRINFIVLMYLCAFFANQDMG